MKSRGIRRTLLTVGAILVLLTGGPFLLPLPPLETVHPEALADADSQFMAVNGLTVHYKTGGSGSPALVLLHGFGASLFTWRELFAAPSPMGRLYAFDRPAFGLTERQLPGAYSPDDQVALTLAMLDQWGLERAVLVGSSAGGTVALRFALRHPDRVSGLILIGPAVYTGGGTPTLIQPLLGVPQVERVGLFALRHILPRSDSLLGVGWLEPSRATPAVMEGYKKPLRAHDWDRALWAFIRASRPFTAEARLGEIRVPTLVVSGDQDRVVPVAESVRLSQRLPNAALALIPDCGHLPHEECPEAFIARISVFLAQHQLADHD